MSNHRLMSNRLTSYARFSHRQRARRRPRSPHGRAHQRRARAQIEASRNYVALKNQNSPASFLLHCATDQ